ncbi:MAG: phage shock protein [Thermococcaceae archaeon]|nr:phage shock protein [Thermococcaceae archaeon]MDK2914798.1 phage shock protein [Thermococcaceae archaeon]
MAKKLVRSKKERMFLGVLGGIAEYLEVDPTLVRLVFVVLFVLNPGAMLILYFLAALVMPEEEGEEEKEVSERLREVVDEAEKKTKEVFSSEETVKTLALILVIIGALLIASSLFPLVFIWPLGGRTLLAIVLLIIGLILLVRGD